MQQILNSGRERDALVDRIRSSVLRELKREFPEAADLSGDEVLQTAFNEIYLKTGEGFIFIVDEWDCVFRAAQNREDLQKEYLNFLNGLFKGAVYVDLVYMTGILPIKKYGEHSAVNMFEEYSIIEPDELSTYFGFTKEEVQGKCREYQVDFEEMKRWYDGYHLDGIHIYNPKAVTNALRKKRFRSYWTGTETYDALKVYIERNFDGLKDAVVCMLGDGGCKVNTCRYPEQGNRTGIPECARRSGVGRFDASIPV